MVARGAEDLVEVRIVEYGILDLESFLAEERREEGVEIDFLFAAQGFHRRLEVQPARVEEREADAVAREFPVAFGGNRLFKK